MEFIKIGIILQDEIFELSVLKYTDGIHIAYCKVYPSLNGCFLITGSMPKNLKQTRMIFLIGKTMNQTVDSLLQQEMEQFGGISNNIFLYTM